MAKYFREIINLFRRIEKSLPSSLDFSLRHADCGNPGSGVCGSGTDSGQLSQTRPFHGRNGLLPERYPSSAHCGLPSGFILLKDAQACTVLSPSPQIGTGRGGGRSQSERRKTTKRRTSGVAVDERHTERDDGFDIVVVGPEDVNVFGAAGGVHDNGRLHDSRCRPFCARLRESASLLSSGRES